MRQRQLKPLKSRDEILAFIIDYKREHDGCAPSFDDVVEGTGYSKSTVSHHIGQLEKYGYLKTEGHRMIAVTGGEWVYP